MISHIKGILVRHDAAFRYLKVGVPILCLVSVLSSCQYGENNANDDFGWEFSPEDVPYSLPCSKNNLGIVEWPKIKYYASYGEKGANVLNELCELSVRDPKNVPLIFFFGFLAKDLSARELNVEFRDQSLDQVMGYVCSEYAVNIHYIPEWQVIVLYDVPLEIETSSSLPVSPKLFEQLNSFVDEKGLSGRVVDVSDFFPLDGYLDKNIRRLDGKLIYVPESITVTRHNLELFDVMMLFDTENKRLLLMAHKKKVLESQLKALVEAGFFVKEDIENEDKEEAGSSKNNAP